MLSTFKENQIIKIIPQDVESTCSVKVLDCCEEFLCVIPTQDLTGREITGKAECFTLADEGIIYFKSKISKIDDRQYKLTLPLSQQTLQRREYTRIDYNANLLLQSSIQQIEVLITDLSAGGMKIVSPKELSMSEDYTFTIQLDKTQAINTTFSVIRQDKNDNNTYTASGKFKSMTNKDRISLAQFCFRKQMENTNK